jgi:flagellar biosynthesis chaperone FliJ
MPNTANENNPDEIQNDETPNPDQQNQNPPAPPQPSSGSLEFADMSARERVLVQKARKEEKDKLYQQIERLRQQVDSAQTQLRQLQQAPAPPTSAGQENRNDQIENLATLIRQTNQTISDRFEALEREGRERLQKEQLRSYKAERLAALRQEGEDVVESLIGGDTIEDIDMSIDIARAEYQYIVQKEEQKRAARGGGGRPPASVRVGTGNGRPAGTAPVLAANNVEAESNESITELTSNEAVRSGSYEKNRNQLLGKLKRSYRYGQPQQ